MENKFKTFESELIKIDRNEKTITHYITSDTIDRDGDIVIPSGGDFSNYLKNPIVLFMHNQYYPIGKNLWLKIEKSGDNEYLLAKTKISDKTDLAQDIFNLYEEKILNAWSIGFKPNWEKAEQIDKGWKFNEWELLEYSAVSIPANPDALTTAIKMVKNEELRNRFEIENIKNQLLSINNKNEDIIKLENEIAELKKLIANTDIKELKLLNEAILELNEKINKLEQKLVKNSTEIAGNSFNLEKVIKEAVAGAISRIKGDLV